MNNELEAIYAIWKREMIRFFRSKSRVIGSLGMPFFFLAILGTGLNSAMAVPQANGGYLQFIAPGILGMVLLFASIFSGIIVIVDRQFGFLKETLVAPVKRTSIVIGKSLGGATAAVFQGILMLGLAMLLGVSINTANIVPILVMMMLVSMAFVSLGVAIASVIDDMHGFQLISNFLIMPMFFLSGALFPLNSAPQLIKTISAIDPLTYSVEALRFLINGQSTIPLTISAGITIAFLAATTFSAVYLFNRIEN